ncbi:MAG: hypothetical protein H7Y33_17015 [Cytophagales bacterium]|nr:hypothetical protein [Rhizobacter sp.]
MSYVVIHREASLQFVSGRLVVPAEEVAAFRTAAECALAMSALHAGRRDELQAALAHAREEGQALGLREGREQAAAEFGAAAAKVAQEARQQQADACAAVATLALAVVRKIATRLGAETMVAELVEQAVASVAPEPVGSVRVHPLAEQAARERLAELDVASIAVIPDATLSVFACVMDTAHGSHLAGLDEQLDTIGRALGVRPQAAVVADMADME